MIVHIIVLVGFSSEQVWVDGSKVKCLESLLLVCLQISWGETTLDPRYYKKGFWKPMIVHMFCWVFPRNGCGWKGLR